MKKNNMINLAFFAFLATACGDLPNDPNSPILGDGWAKIRFSGNDPIKEFNNVLGIYDLNELPHINTTTLNGGIAIYAVGTRSDNGQPFSRSMMLTNESDTSEFDIRFGAYQFYAIAYTDSNFGTTNAMKCGKTSSAVTIPDTSTTVTVNISVSEAGDWGCTDSSTPFNSEIYSGTSWRDGGQNYGTIPVLWVHNCDSMGNLPAAGSICPTGGVYSTKSLKIVLTTYLRGVYTTGDFTGINESTQLSTCVALSGLGKAGTAIALPAGNPNATDDYNRPFAIRIFGDSTSTSCAGIATGSTPTWEFKNGIGSVTTGLSESSGKGKLMRYATPSPNENHLYVTDL